MPFQPPCHQSNQTRPASRENISTNSWTAHQFNRHIKYLIQGFPTTSLTQLLITNRKTAEPDKPRKEIHTETAKLTPESSTTSQRLSSGTPEMNLPSQHRKLLDIQERQKTLLWPHSQTPQPEQ